MKKIFLFFLLFLSLNLNAWAMGKTPPKPKPENPDTALSLSLDEVFDMAVKRSDSLSISREQVKRTVGSFLEATGEAIGDFDYVATEKMQDPQKGGGDNSGASSTLAANDRRERRFEYSQPLFQGFKALGALSGAGSLRKQRQGEYERAQELLFLQVVDAFYDYLRLQQDVTIVEGILTLSEDRVKDLQHWEEIGRSRPSETATARVTMETFRADLSKIKSDLANSRNLLTFLIGVAVDAGELKDEKLPAPSEKPFDLLELVRRRPDVEAARQAVKTARGAVIVAQSQLWPKVTLDANLYEHREGFQSGTNWDTLVTMRVPLGKGGTTIGEVHDALSDWKEAKMTYSMAQRQAQREIMDAYDNWKNYSERHKALEKSMEAAQENFTLQSEDYKRRLVSNLDVLQAMQTLFQTKQDTNMAFYDMKKSFWVFEVAKQGVPAMKAEAQS